MVRTAGHVIDDAVLGSLEYGVSALNIPLIVVLGHDNCGAGHGHEKRGRNRTDAPGFIRDLVERTAPSALTSLREQKTEINDMAVEHATQT